jgi:iron complex outermembrane receptor protein
MRAIYLIILASLFSIQFVDAQKGNKTYVLKGIVTDATTGQALEGASVYIPDIKKGVVTNNKGAYQLTIAEGSYVVEASFIGYAITANTVEIHNNINHDFKLSRTAVEASNVTVTSFLRATSTKRTPTPISILKKEDLFKGAATNFVDALSKTPGVTQLSTGPAISKPIIRGLGYNRVVVLNDGVRQEGQQWGDEHGIEIDEYNVSRTEILKVPASIIYGSEALSGVINVVSNVPVPEGAVRGNIFANYQSNNNLKGSHVDFAGNNKGWVWGINGSSKDASAYKNKYDGYVANSQFKELNGSMYTGVEKEWGYTHFFVSQFNQQLGVIEGERNVDGSFVEQFTDIPYQKVKHTKYTLDNSIKWGAGRIKANMAYQRNERMEFGNVEDPKEKSLYFDLGTLNYSFQYLLPEKNNWKHTIGVNGMQQENKNKGVEVLIPAYKTVDAGLFFYTQKRAHQLTYSGGVRVDKKAVEFVQDGFKVQKDYGAMAGSFGMTYEANNNWVYKLNIAKGYRAPNMAELGSNGAHEGTNRYELGNTSLKSEKSIQFDLGTEWSNEHVSFAGNVFYNMVNDYIFYQKILTAIPLRVDPNFIQHNQGFQFFEFQQNNAKLYGAEASLDLHPHPLDGLHIENTFSYVRGRFDQAVDNSFNLPSIPPFRWIAECRYELDQFIKDTKNTYFSIQFDQVAAQNNAFTGYNTETNTPGYTLINLGAGTQIQQNGKTILSISLVAQNLTDVAYQNHLSRLKYTSVNEVTGRMGVFNMGRNVSLKINIPLVFD